MPLTLTLGGKALPFQQRGGALYFYLPDSTPARYSRQHTLWFTHGRSLVASEPPDDTEPLNTLVAEQRLTGAEQYSPKFVGDPWFWRTLVGPATDEHALETPGRTAGLVKVTLKMAGVTRTEHDVIVLVGGEKAGALHWFGEERHEGVLSLELPAGDTLAISLQVPESARGADISLLDEMVVRYPSAPLAVDGSFRGLSEQAGVVRFESVGAEVMAWQLEPSVAPLPVTADGGSASVTLPANRLLLLTEPELAQVATLEAADEAPISQAGADYVAIVSPELVEAIQPLLAMHEEEGLSTLLVTPQEVYDSYSHGEVDPLAFQALLREGSASWETKPRFVLLVGDSTYDPHGFQVEPPTAYLPSPFVETVFGGETVSDNLIADVDDDGYPDVALGRLPARTPEQVSRYVEKALAYSNDPAEGDWRQRVLLAADGQETLFQAHSERLREDVPSDIEALTVYPNARSDALAEMLPRLNEGSLVVNYVGHGSVQQWGKDQLLTAESASALTNGQRLPIFINMTCLAGLFSHPKQESLAESLLWAAEGGAIAAVAPTSLTLPTNQTQLNISLLQSLLSAERPTVGEALDAAKRTVILNTANDHDIVATFNLLGDPALRPAPQPGVTAGQ